MKTNTTNSILEKIASKFITTSYQWCNRVRGILKLLLFFKRTDDDTCIVNKLARGYEIVTYVYILLAVVLA
jgi:hypothetical protein